MTVMEAPRKRKLVIQRTAQSWPSAVSLPNSDAKAKAMKAAAAVGKVGVWAVKPNTGLLSSNANPMTVKPGTLSKRFKKSTAIDDELLSNPDYVSWPADIRYRAWVDSLASFDRPRVLKNFKLRIYIRLIFSLVWMIIWSKILFASGLDHFLAFFSISFALSSASLVVLVFSAYVQYQSVLHERLLSPLEGIKILFGGVK
ncbi:hypothetical protein [Reinekea sp. G2M2-21]|uniref:hypothetical protein n=1 Tax=Reinekea sp. G2M2-21 TaxID=2788942 RepID=UPI0018AAB26D|nr:hypothetical protein [Reinekea sp. G2M2-21]